MPKATSLREAKTLADAVTALGGAVPDVLANLLAAHSLLASPGPSESPERDILTAALDGTLNQKALDRMLPAAANAHMVSQYRGELARNSEHVLVGQFHRELEAGGADQILDSLRDKFDEHAEAIAHARTLISAESTAEHVIESGQPELVTAWQSLDAHIVSSPKSAQSPANSAAGPPRRSHRSANTQTPMDI